MLVPVLMLVVLLSIPTSEPLGWRELHRLGMWRGAV